MEKEIWRDIPDYENLYKVSNLGRIKSLTRLVRVKNGMRTIKGQILKDKINKLTGYHQIQLSRNGKKSYFFVHRLVYMAFNGEIPEGIQVNHIDENKNNNSLSNLNLMTPKQNMNFGTAIERRCRKQGKKIIMDEDIEFGSIREAARHLGCQMSNVWTCCRKPTYTIYGHHFKYKEESKE